MPLPSRLWLQHFDRAARSGLSLREQLCASLRAHARARRSAVAERLPASRVLAADLGLSRATVEAAYAQLQAEGLLERRHGSGSYLRATPTQATRAAVPGASRPATLSARGQLALRIGGCVDPLTPLPFAAGSPDLRAFPWALWQRLGRRRQGDAPALARYQDPQGLPELRDALAEHLQAARGLAGRPDQLLILTSSQQALQLLASLLLDPGDCVWMEDPGYRGAAACFAAAGARVQPVQVDAEGLCPQADLPPPRLIYLTPAHQYPLGVRLSPARRAQILALARQHGAWVIEDDYDSDFHDAATALPALQTQDPDGRVVYLGTFSKTLMPGLRLAYAQLPDRLMPAALALRSLQDGHSNGWFQALVADFIGGGHYATHLRAMRRLYNARRTLLQQGLAAELPWARVLAPEGCGLQLCVALPQGQGDRLSRAAARAGVVTPGLHSLQKTLDAWLLGFAALTPAEIEGAIARLAPLRP